MKKLWKLASIQLRSITLQYIKASAAIYLQVIKCCRSSLQLRRQCCLPSLTEWRTIPQWPSFLHCAHLWVQVVPPVLRHSQLPIGQTHVVQVSPKAVIGPRPHHVSTRLVEALRGGGRPWWRERRRSWAFPSWLWPGEERGHEGKKSFRKRLEGGRTFCLVKISHLVSAGWGKRCWLSFTREFS